MAKAGPQEQSFDRAVEHAIKASNSIGGMGTDVYNLLLLVGRLPNVFREILDERLKEPTP